MLCSRTSGAFGRCPTEPEKKEILMKLTRVIFLALAVLLPTSWTVAKAEDAPAPAAEGAKKAKKGKKAKKEEGEKKEEKKAE